MLKLERRQNVKKCVQENRDKGEIKKTKGEEDVAEKKRDKKKKKGFCWLYVWCGHGIGLYIYIYILSKLIKKFILEKCYFKILVQKILVNNKLLLLLLLILSNFF